MLTRAGVIWGCWRAVLTHCVLGQAIFSNWHGVLIVGMSVFPPPLFCPMTCAFREMGAGPSPPHLPPPTLAV